MTTHDYDVSDVHTISKTRDFLGNIDVVLNEHTGQIEIFVDDPSYLTGSIVNIQLSVAQARLLGLALLGGVDESIGDGF